MNDPASMDEAPGRLRALFVLSLAELLGMALWFSASAVVPVLTIEWALDDGDRAWLTMSVQIGFVVGTLLSALTNLSDLLNPRRLFAVCALAGAACNAAIPLWSTDIDGALPWRFLTGLFLAGVYPPGMKIMAGWFRRGRGMAIGMLVGTLTIGSASPHLLRALATPDWRQLMLAASLSSVVGGLLCWLFVGDGPYSTRGARFDWRFAARALSDRGVRLANLGYLGHMWELYAVWTWIPLFLAASFATSAPEWVPLAPAASFAVIGIGGLGCVVAGWLADRIGRTTVTIASMAVSGLCCLLAGFAFGAHPLWLLCLCLVWGFAVVADSAQFSASVTELTEAEYVGSALTLQTCLGFLLTLASIRLIPWLSQHLGWQGGFAVLAVGPALGILAMTRLRHLPEASRLGGESPKERLT